jgi:hypothetical protein
VSVNKIGQFDWNVEVVNDPKTTQETILFKVGVGSISFAVNLLPRDASEIGKALVEAARIATTGVLRPTEKDISRILQ